MQIWESLVRYANTEFQQDDPKQALKDFKALVALCMNWSGLVGGDFIDLEKFTVAGSKKARLISVVIGGDNFKLCKDVRRGKSLELLATKYQKDIRQILRWLCTRKPELADAALQFLLLYGNDVKWNTEANKKFDPTGEHGYPFFYIKHPTDYGSIMSPVCMFILDRLERYHEKEEELRAVIPVAACERLGCNKFMVVKRSGRKRFHSDLCRVQASQGSPEEWAAKMRSYRKEYSETIARMLGRRVKRRNRKSDV
jgi:hypothetical protein